MVTHIHVILTMFFPLLSYNPISPVSYILLYIFVSLNIIIHMFVFTLQICNFLILFFWLIKFVLINLIPIVSTTLFEFVLDVPMKKQKVKVGIQYLSACRYFKWKKYISVFGRTCTRAFLETTGRCVCVAITDGIITVIKARCRVARFK